MGYFFLFLVFGAVIGIINDSFTGRFDQIPYGIIAGLVFFLLAGWAFSRSEQKKKQDASLPAPRRNKASTPPRENSNKGSAANALSPERQEKSAPRPGISSENAEMLTRVSGRLRELAVIYEDLRLPNLIAIRDGWMQRETAQRTSRGNAWLFINRDGFVIQYLSQNSTTGKNQFIKKKWSEILGCLDSEYTYWFKDRTSVSFFPTRLEDKIFLSAAWSCLADAMNGSEILFTDLRGSKIGGRLRDAARFVEENMSMVLKAQKIDMAKVPELQLETATDAKSRKSEAPYSREVERLTKPPKEGDLFSGFKLKRQLGGKSGQGFVFLAEHQEAAGNSVVVKVMQQKDFGSHGDPKFHEAAAKFLDEGKLSSNYGHIPFLVTALDWAEDPWPAIIYPLIEGKTVTEVAEHAPITGRAWWDLAHDTLSALYQVHKDNLIHQDIKPDNIMITKDRAVILDFGLAYVSGYTGDFTSYGGTLPFMAPEMLTRKSEEDCEHLTSAADLYALGLVLYWARTRQYPWLPREGNTAEAVVLAHSLMQLDPAPFSREEFQLLRGLLAFEPQQRISARQGLELVSAHVDVESKTRMYEQLELEAYAHKAEEPVPEDEKEEKFTVKGPFNSWSNFEEAINKIIHAKKPRIAVVDLILSGRENLYCQMYREERSWIVECMSDSFTDLSHSRRVRTNFINLGWSPPSGSSPNYMRYIQVEDGAKLPNLLTDAMVLGYGLQASDVKKIQVRLMGSDYDGKGTK